LLINTHTTTSLSAVCLLVLRFFHLVVHTVSPTSRSASPLVSGCVYALRLVTFFAVTQFTHFLPFTVLGSHISLVHWLRISFHDFRFSSRSRTFCAGAAKLSLVSFSRTRSFSHAAYRSAFTRTPRGLRGCYLFSLIALHLHCVCGFTRAFLCCYRFVWVTVSLYTHCTLYLTSHSQLWVLILPRGSAGSRLS